MYMYVHDPEPDLEPEPYSDNMSEPEPSSNFPVPQPWFLEASNNILHIFHVNFPHLFLCPNFCRFVIDRFRLGGKTIIKILQGGLY
jgi:hypothetical protein